MEITGHGAPFRVIRAAKDGCTSAALCELRRMSQFQDKVVVVTGSGRGIGKEIAKAFVARGAKVAIASRTEANSNATAAELSAMGPGTAKATPSTSRTTTPPSNSESRSRPISARSASSSTTPALPATDSPAHERTGLGHGAGHESERRLQRREGFPAHPPQGEDARIINISSVIGLMGNAGQCNYAASKAGLIGFTKALAKEFAGRKVCVNAIAPGFIVTDMTDELTPEIQEGIKKNIPLGTFGEVEDIANAVIFLAGKEARYITGQVLTVDGGMVM